MSKGRYIRCAILGALLAAYGASAAADVVQEIEPNFPMSAAQTLTFDGSGTVTVEASLTSGDADVYAFWAKAGDVVTVDIDNGVKSGPGSVDTIVAIHYPSAPASPAIQPYTVLIGVDDASAPDEGSIGAADSYIGGQVIPADGVYYVSVAGYPNKVTDGGNFLGGPGNMTGTYTLIISGVSPILPPPPPDTGSGTGSDTGSGTGSDTGSGTGSDTGSGTGSDTGSGTGGGPSQFPEQVPAVQTVQIDIRPGQRGFARIDPHSRRDIPVALLSSRQFNPLSIDVATLTFGHAGDERSLKKCYRHGVHVNRDRRRDLVCEFDNQAAGFEASDEVGILRGKLKDGTPFEGTAMLKVIPTKRPHGHRWHQESRRDDDRRHR